MAITFVSSKEDTTSGTSPKTVSIDIGTRTNGLLVVGISYRSALEPDFSATYNGVSMT